MHDPRGRGLASRASLLFDQFIAERHLSLRQVADALDCSDVSVLEWRRGGKVPSWDNRFNIEVYTRPVVAGEEGLVEGAGIQPEWWDDLVDAEKGAATERPAVRPYDLVAVGR